MSQFRLRRLERHKVGGTRNQMKLSIPLPRSPSGKIYRCCPISDCVPNIFQLGEKPTTQTISDEHIPLIRRMPGTPGITCPYCGHDAPDDQFIFRDDIKAAKKYIEWALGQDIADNLEQIARNFNRRTSRSKSPFSLKLELKKRPGKSRPFVWREDLLRDITCNICARSYGVYAIALFCPDCGARNLHLHFQREIELIRQQIELAKKIRDDAGQELAYRLLGNAHEDVLTAFETYLKTIYRFLVRKRLPKEEAEKLCTKRAIGNRFQNIKRGQELFEKIEIDPYETLVKDDLDFLGLNIQKRHVLGHNLGVADETYIEVAQGEQPGQTVRLLADEISRFANICDAVIRSLEDKCDEFLS